MAFDYEVLGTCDDAVLVANKKKYTKEEALKLAREELLHFSMSSEEDLIVRTNFISYGFHNTFDGETVNGWHSKDIYQEERRARNEVEVWLVIGKEYE